MKMMKLALLGGAALAVTSAGAYADDLSALKAEIEALNARVAQLETAPAVPAGYSLMTMTYGDATVVPGNPETDPTYKGYKAHVISVLPTADAPAATTIEWSGSARAGLVYTHSNAGGTYEDSSDFDVVGRGELKVVGKTDTAVGEVGARIKFRSDWYDFDLYPFSSASHANNNVYFKEAWGWWAMTPELTLGGGYTGSLGNIGYGYDGACNCYITDWAGVAFDPGDREQIRLSYASGPFSAGIAVEDARHHTGESAFGGAHDGVGVAGEVAYAGDTVKGEISGIWRDGETSDAWQVGLGLGFGLGDMASISVAAAMGHNHFDDDYWGATILGSVNLSDAMHAELAYGHKHYDGGYDVDGILGGIYYDPVSQLTIGLEGEWFDNEYSYSDSAMIVDLVTVFRF